VTELRILLGLALLIGACWLASEHRDRIRGRDIVVGLVAQVTLALLLLKIALVRQGFSLLTAFIESVDRATGTATGIVFGPPGSEPSSLAFRALPIVLVVSAISAVLFHWRILPAIVRGFAKLLQRSFGISGALGVSAAANVFIGMVEAPVMVRPYLGRMTRSELFATMVCGMATIAGTVFAVYSQMLVGVLDDAAGHLLTASIISAPAALMIARVLVPETEPLTDSNIELPRTAASTMDAVTQGTSDGLKLLLNIVAMLIVLLALVALCNGLLAALPEVAGQPLSLQRMLGWLLAPLVWLLGVPWSEAPLAGSLLGTKTVLNEFLAYRDLAALPADALSARSQLIMTYALCGFANLGSLGIMIGGIGAIIPERRAEVVSLGAKSLVAGTIATCMTGAIVGLIGV
jgi:CNT family concentrative nucleoside transporter